jgi:putative sigma-54 modulation protein
VKISFTGRHVTLKKSWEAYALKRFEKWGTFLKSGTVVHVVFSLEGYRQQVEATGQDGRYTITGKQTTKDMKESIDLLAEKITHQLSRQHEKLTMKKLPIGRIRKRLAPEPLADLAPASSGPRIEHEIYEGKPMTAEEALLELQSTEKPFLVFAESGSKSLAVLVKDKPNRYTLITKA